MKNSLSLPRRSDSSACFTASFFHAGQSRLNCFTSSLFLGNIKLCFVFFTASLFLGESLPTKWSSQKASRSSASQPAVQVQVSI